MVINGKHTSTACTINVGRSFQEQNEQSKNTFTFALFIFAQKVEICNARNNYFSSLYVTWIDAI